MAEDIVVVPARPLPRPMSPLPTSWSAFCFLGCLVTDLAYWRTAEMMWADFSAWLVTIGAVLAFLALIAAVFDAATGRLDRLRPNPWSVVLGYGVVLLAAIVNAMVHTRDAWTSVVPWGVSLSALTVVLVLITWAAARLPLQSDEVTR